MPKVRCPRGHTINLSSGSVPGTINYLNEAEWESSLDEIVGALEAPSPHPSLTLRDRVSDALAGVLYDAYICPECGGLTMPGEEKVRWFLNVPTREDQRAADSGDAGEAH